MPYDIAKGFDGCAYAVVKLTPDGRELAPGGCHQTAIEAGKHLAALQAATASEVRHPGAHDQAVHNPHKGGPGAFVPGKWETVPLKTKEEMKAQMIKEFEAETGKPISQEAVDNIDEMAGYRVEYEAAFDTQKNGPVTLKIAKDAEYPLDAAKRAEMDATIADIQSKYPGEDTFVWGDIREDGVAGATFLGHRSVSLDSGLLAGPNARNGQLEYTMWHEMGHALPVKGGPRSGVIVRADVSDIIDSRTDSVIAKFPQLQNNLSGGKLDVGTQRSLFAQRVSSYAMTDSTEFHAELFAVWNTRNTPGAARGGFVNDIVAEYASQEGWKP